MTEGVTARERESGPSHCHVHSKWDFYSSFAACVQDQVGAGHAYKIR